MCHNIFTLHRYSSIMTAPLSKFESNRTISHGYMVYQIIGGYRKCCHECSLGVDLVIDNLVLYPYVKF